jgi:hypothetical protein
MMRSLAISESANSKCHCPTHSHCVISRNQISVISACFVIVLDIY